MVDLKSNFAIKYIEDQLQWEMGMKVMAEAIVKQKIQSLVEAGQDSREIPVALPLVSDRLPSPPDNSRILEA